MWHYLMKLYQDCSNYAPLVNFGPAQGRWVIGFAYMYVVKALTIFFSKTIGARVCA